MNWNGRNEINWDMLIYFRNLNSKISNQMKCSDKEENIHIWLLNILLKKETNRNVMRSATILILVFYHLFFYSRLFLPKNYVKKTNNEEL